MMHSARILKNAEEIEPVRCIAIDGFAKSTGIREPHSLQNSCETSSLRERRESAKIPIRVSPSRQRVGLGNRPFRSTSSVGPCQLHRHHTISIRERNFTKDSAQRKICPEGKITQLQAGIRNPAKILFRVLIRSASHRLFHIRIRTTFDQLVVKCGNNILPWFSEDRNAIGRRIGTAF